VINSWAFELDARTSEVVWIDGPTNPDNWKQASVDVSTGRILRGPVGLLCSFDQDGRASFRSKAEQEWYDRERRVLQLILSDEATQRWYGEPEKLLFGGDAHSRLTQCVFYEVQERQSSIPCPALP